MAKLTPISIELAEDFKELFSFPIHWSVEHAQFAFDEVRDGTHDSPKESIEGVPLVTSKNLKIGSIDFTNTKTISYKDHEEISKRSAVKEGDLLFSMIGTIGNVAIVPKSNDFSVKNVGLFRRNKILLFEKFSFYWLLSETFQKYLDGKKRGGNQKFVSLGVLRESPIPLPPLNEQKRIADKLDELLAQVDSIKTRVDNIPAILKRFRQSVLAAAVSGQLTEDWRTGRTLNLNLDELNKSKAKLIKEKEIKKDLNFELADPIFTTYNKWNFVLLKSVASKITDGEHSTPKRQDSGKYLLSARNVRDGYISLSNVDYVGNEEFKRLRKRCDPNKGDILISCSGSVGRVSLVDKSDHYVMVRSAALVKTISKYANNRFIMFALMSPQLQKEIETKAKSTAQANLFLGPIKDLPIPLPHLEEQQEIVSRVDALFAFADQIEQRVKDAQARINQLTQSILAKAFRGELVPQDPNDEPASELLARIKAEREQAEALAKAAKKAAKKPVKKKTAAKPKPKKKAKD